MGKQKIFISHIKEEFGFAKILKDLIKRAFVGFFDVFVSSDGKSIPPGSIWLQEIENALLDSKMVLVLCSKASVTRPWINFESGAGWLKKLPILSICHSGMKSGELPSPLNIFQAVSTNDEDCIRCIIECIARLIDSDIPELDYQLVMEKIRAFEAENAGNIYETDKLKYNEDSFLDISVLALNDTDKTLLSNVVNANLVTNENKAGNEGLFLERNAENINRLIRLRSMGYVTVSDEVVYPGGEEIAIGPDGKSIINIKSIYTTNKGFNVVYAIKYLATKGLIQNNNTGEGEAVNLYGDFLMDCHYRECNITVDCYIMDNYIQKVINKHMIIVNPTKSTKKVFVPFSVEMEPLKNANISEIYEITEFKINSVDHLSEVRKKLHRTDLMDGTTLKLDSEYEISLCNDSCTIDVETISKVPLEDKHFTHQLSMPCKNYEIEFRLNNDKYKLSGYSFGQFAAGEKREIKKECGNIIKISFKDWLLPKNGVVFIIDEK